MRRTSGARQPLELGCPRWKGAGEGSPIERLIDVPGLPSTGDLAYAQAVTAGQLVFLAGQAGLDEHGNLVSPEFVPQAKRTFQNIATALGAVGATLHDIVTMTVFIADWRYGAQFLEVRKAALGDHLAASATIGIGQLAAPDMLLEVQCTAVRPVAAV